MLFLTIFQVTGLRLLHKCKAESKKYLKVEIWVELNQDYLLPDLFKDIDTQKQAWKTLENDYWKAINEISNFTKEEAGFKWEVHNNQKPNQNQNNNKNNKYTSKK